MYKYEDIKEKSAFDFSIKQLVIFSVLLFFLALFIPFSIIYKEEAEAYTNDVVPYVNNQVTDLTGTSWLFNSELNLTYQQSLSPMTSQFNVNFVSDNTSFNKMNFGYFLNSLSQPFGTYYNPSQVSVYSKDGWNKQEYRLIVFDSIDAGTDATNQNLINWIYQTATPQFTEYTISSGLVNAHSNISLPLIINEYDTITLEFTPNDGYIFNTYKWSITPQNSFSLSNYVEEPFKISFDISNVTSDLTINIEALPYISLKGQWVLKDFSEMSITATDILDDVYFTSNGHSYYNITALGADYLKYYNDNIYVDVLSLAPDGLMATPLSYLPTNTYNYNLITINSDFYYGVYTNEYNLPTYLKNITYFTEVFRPATQVDLDLISYKNGQISVLQNEYTFINLFGALIDAPITALKGLLNFTFFGVNLFSFLTLFITLAVVYLCIKMVKGGRKNE